MKFLPHLAAIFITLVASTALVSVAIAQDNSGNSPAGAPAVSSENPTGTAPEAQSSATPQKSSGASLKLGYLTCHAAAGWGDIVTSSQKLRCVYSPFHGAPERYTGTITKVGVEVGYSSSAVILWGVVAPSYNVPAGALAGNYGGVNVGATAVYGGGISAIFGGFKHSIELEPITISGDKGLNLAAGVEKLSLHYEGKEPRQQTSKEQ